MSVVLRTLPGQRHVPFLPREQVLQLRDERVRSLVAYAAANVPYYRELDPRDIRTAEELQRLPVLDKKTVQRDPELFRPETRLGPESLTLRTAGSTGTPVTVYRDQRGLLENIAYAERERAVETGLAQRRYRYPAATIVALDGNLPRVRALGFRFLEKADADDYARLRPGVAATAVRHRLEHERCFGAWHDGRLVSARWVASGSADIEYLGRVLALAECEVWISDTFTDPAYRGHDVSPAAGAALARALAAEGVVRQLGGVLPENPLGVRAYEQAGYRRVGTVGYLRIGPWRRDFVRRG
jgi:GNAT superfamily N-acetyltransferase